MQHHYKSNCMLLQNKQIAIVGGGPGGLTLARLLQTKDVTVKIYERDFNPNARVQGSPLDLHEESGLAALEEAQLLDAFKSNFLPGADKKQIVDPNARVFLSDHETKPDENFGHPGFRPEIDRGTLRRILLDSLLPGSMVWNSHFLFMEQRGEGWNLHFKDGSIIYADIVIAADGANSRIRPYITDIKAFYSGITMLEGNICNARETAPQVYSFLKGGKIMAFGNGNNILAGQKANDEIGFYASFEANENWATACGLDFSDKKQVLQWFQTQYSDWSNLWSAFFEAAETPFIPRPIYCMPLDQSWEAQPNLTMLGDAAHVMPPFAGEGVNMAMLDALELYQCLTSGLPTDLREAIGTYETKMRKRAAVAGFESLENGKRMHSATALNDLLELFRLLEETATPKTDR